MDTAGFAPQPRGAAEDELRLVDTSAIVADSVARLERVGPLKRRFAVIRMWPDQAVAEHENVERLRDAARLIGVELVEVDKFGHILGSPNAKISKADVDFVLHLHFETAKTYDAISVAAMWNPTQFYFDWGFKKYWGNQVSHDIFAYTGSQEIRSLVRAVRGDVVAEDMPLLNHTLAEPIYAPAARASYQAFYCGINWEKMSGKKGRHDEVLKALDRAGKLDVYGPEELQGIKVWEGFRGYKGSLPFDGRTVIKRIAQAGACLVFSSDAHKSADIMSNRLFEALAGGAVVIGDEHPFIPKAIGDNYICIPSSLPAEERARLITDALARFEADPAAARELATRAQAHFLNSFHLSAQIANVYESVGRFMARENAILSGLTEPVVDLVLQPLVDEASTVVSRTRELKANVGNAARITIIVGRDQLAWFSEKLSDVARVVGLPSRQTSILMPYDCINAIGAENLTAPKAVFLLGIEELYIDSLLDICQESRGLSVTRVGTLLKHFDSKGGGWFDYIPTSSQLQEVHESAMSSAIFDTAWLKSKIQVRGLSWRDICLIAELEDGCVNESARTCTVINLKEYEAILARDIRQELPVLDTKTLIPLSANLKSTISSSVVTRRPVNQEATIYTNLSGQHILTEVTAMPPLERWALALSLYQSVPIPGWVRKFITFCRKSVGIR